MACWRAASRIAGNSVPAASSPDRTRWAISVPISRYRATVNDLSVSARCYLPVRAPSNGLRLQTTVLRTVEAQTGSVIILRDVA